jgi:hypothetical protein
VDEGAASAGEGIMKKTMTVIGLVLVSFCLAYGQEAGQPYWQVGFHAESWILRAYGFGASIRSWSRYYGYLDFAFTFCPDTWEDHGALLALHLSSLIRLSKKGAGGLFIGPGVSWSPSITIPVFHAKVVALIPLGRSSGIELGSFPLLFGFSYPFAMPIPNFHAGVYFRF